MAAPLSQSRGIVIPSTPSTTPHQVAPRRRPVHPSIVMIVGYLLIGIVAFWPVYPGGSVRPVLSPVVRTNLLMVLSMPVSATAAFVVLRKWDISAASAKRSADLHVPGTFELRLVSNGRRGRAVLTDARERTSKVSARRRSDEGHEPPSGRLWGRDGHKGVVTTRSQTPLTSGWSLPGPDWSHCRKRHRRLRTFGIRAGRLTGSVPHHTFFPQPMFVVPLRRPAVKQSSIPIQLFT